MMRTFPDLSTLRGRTNCSGSQSEMADGHVIEMQWGPRWGRWLLTLDRFLPKAFADFFEREKFARAVGDGHRAAGMLEEEGFRGVLAWRQVLVLANGLRVRSGQAVLAISPKG